MIALTEGTGKDVLKLLPAALAGFVVALFVDKHIPPTEFKHLLSGCLLAVLVVMLWSEWKDFTTAVTCLSVLINLIA